MWPSLGQGCNVALESCQVLAEILATYEGNLEMALPAYTTVRKPDTDAIARLSEEGFGNNQRAGTTKFLAKVIMLSLLNKLFPAIFSTPALLQANQPNVGYSTIERQWKIQEKQLVGLSIGLGLGLIALFIAGNSWLNLI